MSRYQFYITFYLTIITICGSEGAKILGIFPFHSRSHFFCNHAIMKSLIEAGHEITIITPFTELASTANYTSIINVPKTKINLIGKRSLASMTHESVVEHLDIILEAKKPVCDKIAKLPEIQKILKSGEKLYDLVFMEILYVHDCYLPIAEKMQVPVIGTITFRSWLYADRTIGNPNHPAYIPIEVGKDWNPENFFWRLRNTWDVISSEWYNSFVIQPFIEKFYRNNDIRLLDSSANLYEKSISLIFYNNHPSYFPRPMNPNVIEIGGIHVEKAKPLPKIIKKFIDEAEHGVILFTFGSIIDFSTSPPEIINAFREAFAEIPQRVIWKYEKELKNVSSNVMLLEWLPQRDILEHENVKAYISHCGQGGVYEAIYTATPIVAIPGFADQPTTAAILGKLGTSVRLDFNKISKEVLLKAINKIINDTSYKDNMQKLSAHFKDRPISPQQSVVYWTEYVIRHNGAFHLKPYASQLNWFQYLMLDVVCFVVLCFTVILYVAFYVIKKLYLYSSKFKFTDSICDHFKPKQM